MVEKLMEVSTLHYTFQPMNEEDTHTIQSWRYEGQYAVYNLHADPEDNLTSELLDPRSPYYAACNEQGELIGFFCFGTAAQVEDFAEPALYSENNTATVGLGMRPDLAGKGLGFEFVQAGLAFAKKQFAPDYFRLFVLTNNQRAIRVYERAGFQRVRVFVQRNIHGENEFLEMSRKA
jgi:[ribosomal protein S18]-alanine N-acetyltransferase